MVSRRTFNTLLAAGVVTAMTPESIKAQDMPKAKNVVLVHGLYADGSSWLDVIAHLQTAGLNATAVQNPLMSLEEDSAAVRRILAQQDGPTVLVGHSFAGTLISETGGDSIVSALVYVAARAPDAGEDFGALAAKFPKPPASAGTVKGDGYFWLNQEAFLRDFANGVDPARARALRRTRAGRRRAGDRQDLDGRLEGKAELLPGIDRGSHDQSGARAISGEANEGDDD